MTFKHYLRHIPLPLFRCYFFAMKIQTLSRVGASIAILLTASTLALINAQQPTQQPRTAEQVFKNIKVIKTMPANQLQGAMNFMAASLGVDCSYCHTPPAMEKDEKATKETARRMLAMVNEINKNFGDKIVVNCATCHRGKTQPVTIPPLPPLSAPFTAKSVTVNQQPLPTVEEILNRYIKALGGMQALDKVSTRVRKGAVEVAGVQGTFEFYEAAPNKGYLIGSLPSPVGSVQQAFDGSSGWVKNQNGIFDMSGDGLDQVKRDWVFYGDVKLDKQYKVMNVARRERLDSREFYVVLGTRPNGQIERLYFDVQTGLLARRYSETPTYFGGLPNATDYDDYRKVGQVRLPFLVRKVRGGTMLVQTISEYRLNIKVDDTRFKKPVAQK